MQNTPLIYNKPSRPTMPHFLENAIAGLVMPAEPSEPFGAYLQEYMDLGDLFDSTMSFTYFWKMKTRNLLRNFNKWFTQNYELQKTVGRFTIPNFDGTSNCSRKIQV